MTHLNVEIAELTIDQLDEVTAGKGDQTGAGGGGCSHTGVHSSIIL